MAEARNRGLASRLHGRQRMRRGVMVVTAMVLCSTGGAVMAQMGGSPPSNLPPPQGGRQGGMQPFTSSTFELRRMAVENQDFRRVVYTGPNQQIVLMSLKPGESIGREVHRVDQCFVVASGVGIATVGDRAQSLRPGELLCVPAGAPHDVRDDAQEPLKLITIYSPPQHPPRTVHRTRKEAQGATE